MNKICLFFLILLSSSICASDVVIYDPADAIVSNNVTNYLESVNTPEYDGNPYTLIDPDLSSVTGVDKKYWKVTDNSVVEMDLIEKAAVDNAAKKSLELSAANNTNQIKLETDGTIGFRKAVTNGIIDIDLPTADLSFDDAGSLGATEQGWIEVTIDGVTGYIRVWANK